MGDQKQAMGLIMRSVWMRKSGLGDVYKGGEGSGLAGSSEGCLVALQHFGAI